jgi:hypothetical protein
VSRHSKCIIRGSKDKCGKKYVQKITNSLLKINDECICIIMTWLKSYGSELEVRANANYVAKHHLIDMY